MKVLVANLGSTSFKYRLFDLSDPAEPVLARGAIERIGSTSAKVVIQSARGERELVCPIADHGEAVQLCLDQLTDPEIGVLHDAGEVAAIGFKAVHARDLTGVHLVDETVLAAMEAFADVAPAHNPPYTKAMRMLRDRFPGLPLVAAFETGFHRTIPEANQRYAIPDEWATELGIRRWGFHGASHRYIAGRMPELLGRTRHQADLLPPGRKLVALRDPQRRVGRVQPGNEPAVGPAAQQPRGRLRRLRPAGHPARDRQDPRRSARRSWPISRGWKGSSGAGCDLRDIEAAAASGNAEAELAIDVFIASIRHYLGAYLLELDGADAIVFTGGIGENSSRHSSGGLPRAVAGSASSSTRLETPAGRPSEWSRRPAPACRSGPCRPTKRSWSRGRPSNCSSKQHEGDVAMFLARVTGSVVATQKVASMTGQKLLTVEPYRVDEKERDRLVPTGRTFVAVDTLGAGLDEMVLICQGSSARLTPETEKLPIDAVVIGWSTRSTSAAR